MRPRRRKRRVGATDARVLEDAERLIAAWNERQAAGMPMLFSPTIGALAITGDRFADYAAVSTLPAARRGGHWPSPPLRRR